MTRENLDKLQAFYEAANRQDIDTASTFLAPEIEFHLAGVFPDLDPAYRGQAEVRRFVEQFTEPWDVLSMETHEIIDMGARILVLLRFHATGRDGIEVQLPLAHLWTIRDGQVVRMDAYTDQQKAREAAMR